jgi:hypothetical protein
MEIETYVELERRARAVGVVATAKAAEAAASALKPLILELTRFGGHLK